MNADGALFCFFPSFLIAYTLFLYTYIYTVMSNVVMSFFKYLGIVIKHDPSTVYLQSYIKTIARFH
jgi:hypothetical protein